MSVINSISPKQNQYFPEISTLSSGELNNIPEEILLQIFQYLNVWDLLLATQVCKQWKNISEDKLLWEKLLKRDFSHVNLKSKKPLKEKYKFYKKTSHNNDLIDAQIYLGSTKTFFKDLINEQGSNLSLPLMKASF